MSKFVNDSSIGHMSSLTSVKRHHIRMSGISGTHIKYISSIVAINVTVTHPPNG